MISTSTVRFAGVVSVHEMADYMNVGYDGPDDVTISNKIIAAMSHIEKATGISFGDFGDDTPEDLREALRMLTAHFYENREATIVGVTAIPMPLGFDDLIRPYRQVWF